MKQGQKKKREQENQAIKTRKAEQTNLDIMACVALRSRSNPPEFVWACSEPDDMVLCSPKAYEYGE